MDDKYIKKLEKKRLKQEKILLQRRQKLDKKIKKQEAQQKNSYDKNDTTNFLVKTLLEKQENTQEEINNVPTGETLKNKQNRLLKERTTLYQKHNNMMSEALEIVNEKIVKQNKKNVAELERKYNIIVKDLKTDLDENLENCNDTKDRRELRNDYRESVEEETEELQSEIEDIIDDEPEFVEEYEEKIITINENYENDINDIKNNIFNDNDIKQIKKEFETKQTLLEKLKENYDENDNGASSLNTETESLSPSINKLAAILGTILGIIITFLIGYTIIDEIISVSKIEQLQTMFNDIAPILLLLSPLILITIYYLFKALTDKTLT